MGNKKNNTFIKVNAANNKEIIPQFIDKNAAQLLSGIENGDDSKVIISFIHLQNDFQCFCDWSKVEMRDFWAFYKKVHGFTWRNIYATGGKTNKSGLAYTIIPINNYPSDNFKNKLSPDINIFELRVSNKSRVHGFRIKSVFYICWLDKNHTIT